MDNYKYGVYGKIGDDIAKNASEAGTARYISAPRPLIFSPIIPAR